MKQVLIITYYWPPAGGPGVQRWLKFVKYLREFDIEPVVYIPKNPNYPIIDNELKAEVPEGTNILTQPIFEPYKLAGIFSKKEAKTISSGIIADEKKQGFLQKMLLYIRGNYFIPDARKFWVKPSVNFLKDYLQQENIVSVITTGPPHSLHLIGLNLKKEIGINWIADFRDPWTQIGYHSKLRLTKNSQKKHQILEKQVLETADKIIVTSFSTKSEFELKTSQPVHLITNGYDEVAFSEEIIRDKEFSFSHIGSLLSGRNPKILWKVFKELIEENEDFKNTFKLKLVGTVSPEVIKSIEEYGLKAYLELIPYVKHSEALIIQRQTQVLLLLEIDSEQTRGILPGKLFEYLYAKRPILAIGPKNWDAQRIISETNAGRTFNFEQEEKLKEYIQFLFSEFKQGNSNRTTINIEQYSRRELTGKLAKLLK